MKITSKALAILGIAAIACSAWSQGGQGRGRGFGGQMDRLQLVQRADVQEDLKITEEEKTKIAAVTKAYEDEASAARENLQAAGGDFAAMRAEMKKISDKYNPQIAGILTADQNKRLDEIKIQMGGARIVSDPEVAKTLGLTDDQNSKIKDAIDKNGSDRRALFQNSHGDRQSMAGEM